MASINYERLQGKLNILAELTMQFYRRNYIEGLFLSSGIFKSGNYTMERLVEVAKILRTRERFNGYIHLKAIPGASKELLIEAGLYADRLSANIEIPTESGLALLAPEKSHEQLKAPMQTVKEQIITLREKHRMEAFVRSEHPTEDIYFARVEPDFNVLTLIGEHLRQRYQDQHLQKQR